MDQKKNKQKPSISFIVLLIVGVAIVLALLVGFINSMPDTSPPDVVDVTTAPQDKPSTNDNSDIAEVAFPYYISLSEVDTLTGKSVFVFSHKDCAFCQQFIAETLTPYSTTPDSLPIYILELSIQENAQWAEELGITSTPTTLILSDTQALHAFSGYLEMGEFLEELDTALTK